MSMKNRLAAWGDLWRRYAAGFRHYWAIRSTFALPPLQAQEAEFLPAALALQNTPVSPVGRWVARIMMLMCMVLFVWSVLGKLDISVNAPGKIIPSERTKTIASVEVARVTGIYVKEGQAVKAGDVLLELDARSSDSERDKAQGDNALASLQAARSRALVVALETQSPPRMVSTAAMATISRDSADDAHRHLAGQWADYSAKLQRIDSEIRHFSESLPLVAQRAKDYAELARTRDVPSHASSEKQQALVDLQGQLRDARNQRATLIAETRKIAQEALNDASRVMAQSGQDARRAIVRSDLLTMTSPTDGTVQQLTVHTLGGVVAAAQPLMQIVPTQGAVEVEAFVESKDIGFVQEGQMAQVKIDAFEYAKFGTVAAKVLHVSRDAIQDEKRGLLYAIKVVLDKPTLQIDERQVSLAPGMSTMVEVKTGSRRVIEYVLSPLKQHGRESLRER